MYKFLKRGLPIVISLLVLTVLVWAASTTMYSGSTGSVNYATTGTVNTVSSGLNLNVDLNIINIPGTGLTYNKNNCNLTTIWHNLTTTTDYRTNGTVRVTTNLNSDNNAICCCIKDANGVILPNGTSVIVLFYDSDTFSGDDTIGSMNATVVDGCVVAKRSFNSTYDDAIEGASEGELYFTVKVGGTPVCYSGESASANQPLYIKSTPGCTSDAQCTSPQRCIGGSCRDLCAGVSCDSSKVCDQQTGGCVPKDCTSSVDCGDTSVFKCNTCPEDDKFTLIRGQTIIAKGYTVTLNEITLSSASLSINGILSSLTSGQTKSIGGASVYANRIYSLTTSSDKTLEFCVDGSPKCDQCNTVTISGTQYPDCNNDGIPYDGNCTGDSNCTSGKICLDWNCTAGCRNNSQCLSSQVCTANQCVPKDCTRDSDCGNLTKYRCSETGVNTNLFSCVSCSGSGCTSCSGSGASYVDCPSDERCIGGSCVAKSCSKDGDCGDVSKYRCVTSSSSLYQSLITGLAIYDTLSVGTALNSTCVACSGTNCTSCTSNADCAPTSKCLSSKCVVNGTKCTTNSNCPIGKICRTTVGDCVDAPSCTSSAGCPLTAPNCCSGVCAVASCSGSGDVDDEEPPVGGDASCSSLGGIICPNGNCGPGSTLSGEASSANCCVSTDLIEPPSCRTLIYSPVAGGSVAVMRECRNIDDDLDHELVETTCLPVDADSFDNCLENAIPDSEDRTYTVASELCSISGQIETPWFGTLAIVLAFVVLIVFYILRARKSKSRKVLKKKR